MSTATITAPAAPVAPWTDEDRLRALVAEWITDRGVRNRAGYDAEKTADRVVASLHGATLYGMVRDDDSLYLRRCCEDIKDSDDLTPGEEVSEDWFYGNGEARTFGRTA